MREQASRMLIHRYVFCIICSLFTVECSIFSINNKYSSKQTLKSIKIENGMIELEGRFKRSVTTPKPNNATSPSHPATTIITPLDTTTTGHYVHGSEGDQEIAVHTSVLNGTEKSNQAFIHWIGKGKSERIIVLTCTQNISDGSRRVVTSQIWRSDNYGTSFAKTSFEPGATISYFYTFPQNEKKLLFTDVSANNVYVTENELDSWRIFPVPVEPDVLLPHPTDENKILLYSLNQRKLYVSTDFAKTWTHLLDNVLPNFYWGFKGIDSNVDIVHMEIAAAAPSLANYRTCILPDCKNEPIDQVGPFLADSLVVHKEYIFVQKSSTTGSENYLMVSYNRSTFQRAYFPGDLKTDDFMLLNLDDGQVFIAVNHGDYVNLYLSEVTGQYYVLSFTNIYHIMRLGYFEIDFHEVQGMNWTFLANKRESDGVKTYISFDKGGNWSPLNKSCPVAEQCFLLLEVKQSSLLPSMLSQENAPGIILAHGIIQKTSQIQETAVFTSNDGGATWQKALVSNVTPLVGRYRFNFLDQGSILTAIPDGLFTGLGNNTVFYSCDEGKSWKQQNFDRNGLIIKGVLTEPGSLTMVESVFGHERFGMPWTVIKLNFSNILSVKCKQSDYFDWHPTDYNNVKPSDKNCILGQKISYTRRIPDNKCYNGEDVIAKTGRNATCECTAEDYECDFGYEEQGNNCAQAKWFDTFYPTKCDEGGTYGKSRGYRKIPADVCVENKSDEEKYGNVKTDCLSAAPSKLSIVLEASKLPSGKEIVFHLEQAGGSKYDSNYTWNFGDGSNPVGDTGFKNASIKKHIFLMAGHYTVSVTAVNTKGKTNTSVQVHVQDPLVSVYLVAPVGGKTGMPVAFSVFPTSSTRMVDTTSDHVHFVWTFGDTSPQSLPLLTWNNSATHTFSKAGTYKLSVEAVNSVSSVYKERSIKMFDDAEILVLTFSSNVNKYMSIPIFPELFTLRLKQQMAEDLGVNLARLEAVIASIAPTTAHFFIFPFTEPGEGEETVANIMDKVISQVQKGVLGVNLFGKLHEAGEIISISSATKLSSPDHPSGPNMKAVYIAAPVLVLVVAASIVSFMYCRKKLHSLRQYNMLHTQDDSDALLDDDEAPLDLNVDFGTREISRDDTLLDAGGSHLVMVTGGGSSDNAENC